MGSIHDSMAAHFGAPMLFSHFGERDENGDLKPIEYRSTETSSAFEWPAIVSQVQFQDDVTPQGEIVRIENRTIVVERALMAADGVTKFQKNARVKIDDVDWELREIDSRFGGTLVTLSLQRKVLNDLGGRRGTV